MEEKSTRIFTPKGPCLFVEAVVLKAILYAHSSILKGGGTDQVPTVSSPVKRA